MLTPAGAPRAGTKRESGVEIGVVALSTLVAIGVSVLFLVLIGAGRNRSALGHHPLGPPALTQYYGTRAPPTAIQIRTTPAHEPRRSRSWAGDPRACKEEK